MLIALKILLGLYTLQGLIKFVNLFAIPYPIRIRRIAAAHGRFIKVFDDVLLVLMAVLVTLLALTGLEHLSFITGLLVGLTLTQLLFHRFDRPLSPEKSPQEPVTPIKVMSYAIQATPGLAWREIIVQSGLFVWALTMLVTQGV